MTVLRDIKARKLYFALQGRFVKSQNPECAMRWMQEAMKPETSFLQFVTGGDAPVAIATEGRGGIHSHPGSPACPGAAYCQLGLGRAMFAERVDGESLLFSAALTAGSRRNGCRWRCSAGKGSPAAGGCSPLIAPMKAEYGHIGKITYCFYSHFYVADSGARW